MDMRLQLMDFQNKVVSLQLSNGANLAGIIESLEEDYIVLLPHNSKSTPWKLTRIMLDQIIAVSLWKETGDT
jgi:hypothetical protein